MEKHKVFLSDKGTNINKIRHVDKDKAISDDKQLCKTLSNFLQEVMKTPGVSEPFHTSSYSQSDPVNDAMRKYEKYSSVLKISETVTIAQTFYLSELIKLMLKMQLTL